MLRETLGQSREQSNTGSGREYPSFLDMPQENADHSKSNRYGKKPDRSCLICHQRKVRCDKRLPCGQCVRNGVLCGYPSVEKSALRPPRTTIADIAARLGQLERTIVAITSHSPSKAPAGTEVARATAIAPAPRLQDAGPISNPTTEGQSPARSDMGGILVQNGSSSNYISEILLLHVLKEEEEILSVMAKRESPDNDDNKAPSFASDFGFLGMISGRNAYTTLDASSSSLPSTGQAMELWYVFTRNIHPLSAIFHLPSIEVNVFDAMNKPDAIDPNLKCALFSIYLSAITSIEPSRVKHILGEDKAQACIRFKSGLERSLIECNFIEDPTLMALQALTLYLKTSRARRHGRSMWIISGVAIRAAQSIGLHRDASNSKLSLFETEMRRRVWWQLMTQDWRGAEDHGIALADYHMSSDTHFPLNVNDNELDPSMTRLPQSRDRWTDMTASLVMMMVSDAMQKLSKLQVGYSLMDMAPDEGQRKTIVDRLFANVERLLAYCNPAVPIQRATIILSRTTIRKVNFISRQQWLAVNPSANTETAWQRQKVHATEQNLVDACEITELILDMQKDEQLKDYQWTGEGYPQYHIILYLLWHMCTRPEGGSIDRAWRAINAIFSGETQTRVRQGGPSGSKWLTLKAMREKAKKVRETLHDGSSADSTVPGEGDESGGMTGGSSSESHDIIFEDSFSDQQMSCFGEEFMDWSAFLDGLNAKGHGSST